MNGDPTWLFEKRRTGRTTRMLEAIKKECLVGSYIFAVLPNYYLAKEARIQFERMIMSGNFTSTSGKTYYNGGQISWASCENHSWSWERMKFVGAHPSCLYFVDPSCVEVHFFNLLKIWHKFDGETK